MGIATLVPVEEYLSTNYDPDCDYIDGEVRERNVGEGPHSDLQSYFTSLFFVHRKEWNIHVRAEQRLQVDAKRYRIPDIMVMRATDPRDAIVNVPPLICIEVLSKGQSLREISDRADDYFRMGVEHVWAVDPLRRAAYYASTEGFRPAEDGYLRVPGSPIQVALLELFAELDN